MFTDRRSLLSHAGMGIAFARSAFALAPQPQIAVTESGTALFRLAQRSKADANDTSRFQKTIDEAASHGGGTVHVPAGRYIVGSVFLRSHVSLWLDNGSVIVMSPNDSDFQPAETLPFDPGANRATSDFHIALFIGEGVEHVSIHGSGLIECERGKQGSGPKPIALRRCAHVTLLGITLRNAQNYNISMLGCQFVQVRGVTIQGGKADGIDPDCCQNVSISDCYIESYDDSLCLKASGSLGVRGMTENVVVTNCVLKTASVHFKCGTESCGDFRNISVSNCLFEGGVGMRHGNPGIALYTVDGGNLQGISISNLSMWQVGTPLAILRGDRDRCGTGKGPGTLSNVQIDNVLAVGATQPSVIAGLPGAPVQHIAISNFSVELRADGKAHQLQTVPENPKGYPAPIMFGELPAFGMYVRHAENLSLTNFVCQAPLQENRPDLSFDDVAMLRVQGHERRGGQGPVHLTMNDVRDSFVHCLAVTAPPANAFRITGAKTQSLYLRGDGAIDWSQQLSLGADVPSSAVNAR